MKTKHYRGNDETVTIQDARDRFIENINEIVNVKIQVDGILARPINEFVNFLESKEIMFVCQISTNTLSEFRMAVGTNTTDYEEQVLFTAVGAFIYMCVSESWVPEAVALVWDDMCKESNHAQTNHQIGLN